MEKDLFSLKEIHLRSSIPLRRLQYVVEKELGPFQEVELEETQRGSARFYSPGGATVIACAALLLDAGIRRDAVKSFLWDFDRIPTRSKVRSNLDYFINSLDFDSHQDFRILAADSSHVRCIAGKLDSNWMRTEDSGLAADPKYAPTVVVTVKLHLIRALFNETKA